MRGRGSSVGVVTDIVYNYRSNKTRADLWWTLHGAQVQRFSSVGAWWYCKLSVARADVHTDGVDKDTCMTHSRQRPGNLRTMLPILLGHHTPTLTTIAAIQHRDML